MIGTGSVWATSAISEPSVTTISTPRLSAVSAMPSANVRQRRLGSVPARRSRSRSAPGGVAASSTLPGHSISRVCPSVMRDRRPVRLEVEELLRIDLSDQLRVERLRRRGECGRRRARGVVPAGECADENRGSKLRRLGLPGERVHGSRLAPRGGSSGCPVDFGDSTTMEATAQTTRIAELRPGQRFSGVYACVRKDRLSARNGSIYLSAGAARPHRIDPGAGLPGGRPARRTIRARRRDPGLRQGGAIPRRAGRRGRGHPADRRRRSSTRPSFCPPPTATPRSSRGSSST